MDITLAGGSITYQPDDDQLGGISIDLAAFDGEIGEGLLPVPDPDHFIDVDTGLQARVDEGTTLLSDGFMLDQDRTRGPVPADGQRLYGFGWQDANRLLDGFRIFRHRPAETDYARVIAFAAIDLPDADTAWVLNANTITLPAKLYNSDGGWTSELIPDLISYTGKTLFLHDKADGSGRCLHYHNLTSGHTSGLTISDVIPDVLASPATVYFPWNPSRSRTSASLINNVKGVDQANRQSVQSDATSIAAHDADGLRHQELLSLEANNQADLNAQVAAELASFKGDLDTYQCDIGPLDEDALALIRVGDLIPVTSTVMGLTDSAKRIAHMTLTVVIGENGRAAPGLWMAHLELGAPIRRRARVRNKAITDRIVHGAVQDTGGGAVGACVNVSALGGPWVDMTGSPTIPILGGGFGDAVEFLTTPGTVGPTGYFRRDWELDFATALSARHCVLTYTIGVGALDTSGSPTLIPVSVGDIGVLPINFINGGLTAIPDQWSSGTAYSIGDYVLAPDVGASTSFYKANANGTNHPPATSPAFWDNVGIMLSDQMIWQCKLVCDGSREYFYVWPAGSSEPSYPNFGEGVLVGTTLDKVYVYAEHFSGAINGTWPSNVTVGNLFLCYDGDGTPVAFHGQWYGPIELGVADGSTSAFDMPPYPGNGLFVGHVLGFVNGQAQPVTVVDTSPPGTIDFGTDPADGDEIDATWLVP